MRLAAASIRRLSRDSERLNTAILKARNLNVAPSIINALVAAEDRRYFRHPGVDPVAIFRVLARTPLGGPPQGASTIEQQLVRTVTSRYERTARRKFREVLLAIWVSIRYNKHWIARAYLRVAYFGWSMVGVRQACARLAIPLETALPHQAASLVARLKYPEPRNASPVRLEQIDRRTRYISRLTTTHGQERRGLGLASPSLLSWPRTLLPRNRRLPYFDP
jgi:membrane peptidoglycan carboxypeptidase